MKIPIQQAKEMREMLNATHLVIFAVDDEGQCVATHGGTERQAKEAAVAGNKLKNALGWPEDLCKDKPLKRICRNCVFYKPDYGLHCFNGWSKDGSDGHCLVEPSVIRVGGDHGCRHFDPGA